MHTYSPKQSRTLIFTTRIRFSPQSQAIKETAIDKLIERQLYLLHNDGGVTLNNILSHEPICLKDGTPILHRVDVEKSLNRMLDNQRIVKKKISGEVRYMLPDETLSEHEAIKEANEKRFQQVLERLFKNSIEGVEAYYEPFLECLCTIFSQLGETYVRLIKGELGSDELVRLPIIGQALEEVKRRYHWIDSSLFESAIISFFQDTHPDYDAIKWNMAQNYYVAKAVGLDSSGRLLSEEVFKNAVFYLDTNVLIQALEPKAQHHRSFKTLSKACKALQVQLNVCQISLDELDHVVEYYRRLIAKVADQIPNDIAPKIRGIFFRVYREELESKGSVDFDQLFSIFEKPMGELSETYGVGLVDDSWFTTATHEPETKRLMEEIKRKYILKRRRSKSMASAIHDALLLRWLALERADSTENTWLVTLDTSLPSFSPGKNNSNSRPLAITLDALLQWISPIAIYEEADENEIASIFSEAVKYQLLPRETFFDLNDFLVFAEMEWSCKELPAKDVEECIRYIRKVVPDLDPSEASDREKIMREISKFFTDPGRKYKQDIQRLENKIEEMMSQNRRFVSQLAEKHTEIKSLQDNFTALKDTEHKRSLKHSAQLRATLASLLFLVYETIAFYFIWKYGEGINFFQKIVNCWVIPATGGIVGPFLFWFIVGKKMIRALGWPFTKIIRSD